MSRARERLARRIVSAAGHPSQGTLLGITFYAVGGVGARIGALSQGLSFFASRDLFAQRSNPNGFTFYTAGETVAVLGDRAHFYSVGGVSAHRSTQLKAELLC